MGRTPIMATLSEVARIAGVTTATVSNVLRNPAKVKPSTVERVQVAIAQLGYRPNLMARALAEGKSSMVALLLPSITNPFYPEFIQIAERVARQRQYFLMVCNTDESANNARAYLNQIAGTLADGVLLLHSGLPTTEIADLGANRCPMVLALEESNDLLDAVPRVSMDFRKAGQLAGEHLAGLGHHHIGVIVGSGNDGQQRLRLEGFKEALAQAGNDASKDCIRYTEDTISGGYSATMSLLDAMPELTAIFATNDLMALGAAHAIADKDIRIPEEISLMGITDIHMAQEMRPALSTVALNLGEAARAAINLLLDLIENPAHEPRQVQAPEPRLVIRQTTAARRN